jgi:phage virion morphogenesis protein
MEIRVDTSQIERANKALQVGVWKVTGRGQQRRMMRGAGDLIRDIVQNRIATKKYDPDGQAWRPWSPNYRAPKHGGHTLLHLTGAMMKRVRRTRGTRKIAIGTPVVYGAVHQFGHTFTNAFGRGIKVHVPARPYLGWGPDEIDGVDTVAQSWLEGAFRWR